MNDAADTRRFQIILWLISIRGGNDKLVPDRGGLVPQFRQRNHRVVHLVQIGCANAVTVSIKLIKILKLDALTTRPGARPTANWYRQPYYNSFSLP